MSVGDIKGSRRRITLLKRLGHYPKGSSLNVHQAVAREKARAEAERKRAAGKKK